MISLAKLERDLILLVKYATGLGYNEEHTAD
jgi:hypothetical protein